MDTKPTPLSPFSKETPDEQIPLLGQQTNMSKPWRFKKPAILTTMVILLGATVVVSLMLYHKQVQGAIHPAHNSDQDTERDLYKLEQAITKNAADGSLPTSLSDLNVSNLANKITNYNYTTPDGSTPDGSPTLSYIICATFKSKGAHYNSGAVEVDAYNAHSKGLQCFDNSYYEGESHVAPTFVNNTQSPKP